MAKYEKTYSSGGKQTSTANQVISFQNSSGSNFVVQYLSFQTFGTECHIKLNDEDTLHWVDANNEFVMQDFNISKITIVESGIQYYYTALSE